MILRAEFVAPHAIISAIKSADIICTSEETTQSSVRVTFTISTEDDTPAQTGSGFQHIYRN